MIEQIVGAKRDLYRHIARAVESEQRVYILHSQTCLRLTEALGETLAECPGSIALDRHGVWDGYRDQPVIVRVHDGRLIPTEVIEP